MPATGSLWYMIYVQMHLMSFCLAKTASLCLCVLYSNNLNVFALPLQMKVWVGFPQSSRDQQLPHCRLVLGWDKPHKGSCGSLQNTFFLPERRCCSERDPSCLPEAHAATPMPGAGLLKSFAWVCRANSCSRVSLLYSFLLVCNHLFRFFFSFLVILMLYTFSWRKWLNSQLKKHTSQENMICKSNI